MKLLRYGPPGKEKPGILDKSGQIRDLSGTVSDITPDVLSPASLERLKKLDPARLPPVTGDPRIGPPVAHVPKIIAVGLNYRDHANEATMKIPTEPVLFMKTITSYSGPNDTVVLPKGAIKGDWEVELGIFIGTKAQYVSEADAMKHVAGYCIVNDVSERYFQLERGPQWMKGKGCDTFCPTGPWLVTPDEVADPQNLEVMCEVSGQVMQKASTKDMIFNCATIISYTSQFLTLMPGDLIATGTPSGVGMGRNRFLKAGDTMRLTVTGLGEQRQKVVAYPG
jgi:2-keto-4-pentenoate hydratase/2-oxohepta-3-ene-1,7-dioic acid hydratase in catechol pathway